MSWATNTRRRVRRRRRWQGLLQVALLVGGTFSVVGYSLLTVDTNLHPNFRSPSRTLLQSIEPTTANNDTNATVTKSAPLFPPDLFTVEERLHGALIFHILGMIYMFVCLAIVCDEFFVPALDVIIEKLEISEDVAGATFMAAGGSAPELFTSVIGVFISFDDVGIGTIVGSAVFNILFVIAMCVLFSRTVLDLTWWPIFRDITFYSVSLLMLVIFFLDSNIYWYEALSMFSIYILYCTFMKVNEPFEKFVKKHINKNKVTRVGSTDHLVPNHQAAAQQLHQAPVTGSNMAAGRRQSVPVLHSGTKFRQGLLQLMIHTIDPLHDGRVDEKATQLHAIASLKVLLDATKPLNGRVETYRSDGLSPDPRPDAQSHLSGRSSQATEVTHVDSVMSSDLVSPGGPQTNGDVALDNNSLTNNVSYGARTIRRISYKAAQNGDNNMLGTLTESDDPETLTPGVSTNGSGVSRDVAAPLVPLHVRVKPAPGREWIVSSDIDDLDATENDEITKPIDLSWPDTTMKRITYILVAPIIFTLWITLPDTRTPRGKRFFFVTFLGSILWIAIYSYLMVWWATVVGETVGIPPEVMGLTILAAGTSVPDLITSVIVARKGFGDMAVSSSIGSNIFDVCVGLPVPWLLFSMGHAVSRVINEVDDPFNVPPIEVSAGGMACSIILLFMMLMFVLISIIVSRWKMNKGLGVAMFLLYFVFVAISLSFTYGKIVCPV